LSDPTRLPYRCPVSGPNAVVQVWTVPLRASTATVEILAGLLDAVEVARCARLREKADRDRFVVAHSATRLILARHLGMPPDRIRWRRNERGKPSLDGIPDAPEVSFSHSGDLALAAVAPRAVGVDVERVKERWRSSPPVRLFPAPEAEAVAAADPRERAEMFVQLLTRKEACVKAAGATMLPHGVGLRVLGADPTLVHGWGASWLVRRLPVPTGYGACVALAGSAMFSVVRHSWVMSG
jgi:4'-phosphopantetheinyl transferase